MKIRSILLTSAGVLFCAASISATTLAHTWVSGSGSDSNTCTFASPCATFTGALAKTVAGGMISAKDAGDFGAVTITQSVTIDGSNLGSIATNNVGVQINNTNSTPIDVVLLNLTISGTGQTMYGIEMSGAINLTVDNCRFINLSGDVDEGHACRGVEPQLFSITFQAGSSFLCVFGPGFKPRKAVTGCISPR